MFEKFLVLLLVAICHVYNVCIVGFCLPGLAADEAPSCGSTIAVLASTLFVIEFILPEFQINELPPILMGFYKVLIALLLANLFFNIIWLPGITFIGKAFENLAQNFQWIPGCNFIIKNNIFGLNEMEIVAALGLLFYASKATGALENMLCMLKIQRRHSLQFEYE